MIEWEWCLSVLRDKHYSHVTASNNIKLCFEVMFGNH